MSNLMETGAVCRGCLATDRTLTSIENYDHIYHEILKDSVKVHHESEIPFMCWECNAYLRNFEKFRHRVLEADLLLSDLSKGSQFKTLSTLTVIIKQNIIDVKLSEDVKIETAPSINCDGNVKVDIEIKEEPIDIKPTDDYDDYQEPIDFNEFFQNNDLVAENVKLDPDEDALKIVKQVEHKAKIQSKVKAERKVHKKNYKVIFLNTNKEMSKCVRIDDNEMAYWMEQEKTKRSYKIRKYKCEMCITGFSKKKLYLRHITNFHNESYDQFICDICTRRFHTKPNMVRHIRLHYTKFRCKSCEFECYRNHQMEQHLLSSHRRSVECLKCGLLFSQLPQFHEHYRRLHKHVVCDYCGKRKSRKSKLIAHIRRFHTAHRCEHCNKPYKTFEGLVHHNKLHHVKSASELCYCVECNIQFDNVALYTRHISISTKHKKKAGIPCPECDKVYDRRSSMTNHYNHVHLKKTKHYCEPCEKYFLNGYRLRRHKASKHDKVPPVKNKMCPYCPRGFSTNRILENHIRTHTGERPFECDYCPAAFSQKQALQSHTRAIHKILDFK
ncbi:zinc finger protein 436-like isoform X2 [Aricia agestis]|uniref:zinc finger protein 436-like isoform X2 n=1 Tax=Aricia agestis TaxID=91739 RepID=UPI001C20495B|nr:zinc finger protein 436-like isoform X2 [Aricia agestis]